MFPLPPLPRESQSPPRKPKRYYLPLSLSLDDLRERKNRVAARESAKNDVLPATPMSPPGFFDSILAVRIQARHLANRRKSSRQLAVMNLNHTKVEVKRTHHAFKKRNKKQLLLKVGKSASEREDVHSPPEKMKNPFTSPATPPSTDNHFLSAGSPKKHRLFSGFHKKGNVSPSRSIVSAKELFTSSPMRFLKSASNTVSRTFSSPKKKPSASTHDIPSLDPSAKWYSPLKSPASLLVTAWKQKKQYGSNTLLSPTAPTTTNHEKTNRSLSTPNACTPKEGKFKFLLNPGHTSTEDFCCSSDDFSLYDEIEQSHQLKRMSIPDQRTLDEMNDTSRGFSPRKYSETYRPLMDFPRKCSTVLEIEPAVLGTCSELPRSLSGDSEGEEEILKTAPVVPNRRSVRKSSDFQSSRAFFEERTSKSTSDVRVSSPVPQNPALLSPSDENGRAKSVAELASFFSRF